MTWLPGSPWNHRQKTERLLREVRHHARLVLENMGRSTTQEKRTWTLARNTLRRKLIRLHEAIGPEHDKTSEGEGNEKRRYDKNLQ